MPQDCDNLCGDCQMCSDSYPHADYGSTEMTLDSRSADLHRPKNNELGLLAKSGSGFLDLAAA